MSDTILSELQALWDELNQTDAERREQELRSRLKQRARQYAAPQRFEETYSEDERYHVLTFALGRERYGVDVTTIRGVRSAEHITRIPAVPEFYRGIVNVRGQIISVLDLRYFFEIPVDERITPQELIIVEAADLTLGVLADHIEDVQMIPRRAVEAVDAHYARGVTTERLVVLDVASIFADERLIIGGEKSS